MGVLLHKTDGHRGDEWWGRGGTLVGPGWDGDDIEVWYSMTASAWEYNMCIISPFFSYGAIIAP